MDQVKEKSNFEVVYDGSNWRKASFVEVFSKDQPFIIRTYNNMIELKDRYLYPNTLTFVESSDLCCLSSDIHFLRIYNKQPSMVDLYIYGQPNWTERSNAKAAVDKDWTDCNKPMYLGDFLPDLPDEPESEKPEVPVHIFTENDLLAACIHCIPYYESTKLFNVSWWSFEPLIHHLTGALYDSAIEKEIIYAMTSNPDQFDVVSVCNKDGNILKSLWRIK